MGQGFDLLGSITRLFPERPPPPIDTSRIRSVLIIKLSSVGDVIHALPVASALKRRHPSPRIAWAIEEWTYPLVRNHPAVDRIVVFPTMVSRPSDPVAWTRRLREAIKELRSESYDAAVDLQGLARSAAVSLMSRSRLRIARRAQREGAHLVSFGVPLPDGRLHAVEEYLLVAAALGAAIEPVVFALQVSAEASAAMDRLLTQRGIARDTPLIVVNPSPSRGWKSWGPERWAAVADALADCGRVLLVGRKDQSSAHRAIAGHMRNPVSDLTGLTTLSELVALLDKASLHVAPDTGTVHISAALGRPVVAVYGPTRPWRLGPYGQGDSVVYHGDLCGRECPAYCLRRRRCLTAATSEEVIDKARTILGRAALTSP